MTQKWTNESSSSSSSDRLGWYGGTGLLCDPIHLSNGTLVWLDTNPADTAISLNYSSDHTTVNNIAVFTSGAQNLFGMCVTRDASNNLYVTSHGTGTGNSNTACTAFVKGSGYSWTQQTTLSTTSNSSYPNFGVRNALWVNDGGGTNNAGHLLVGTYSGEAITLDAGAALAGSGSLGPINAAGSFSLNSWWMMAQNGFGGTNGLMTSQLNGGSITVETWSVSSAGVITPNATTTPTQNIYTGGIYGQTEKAALLNIGSGVYVLVYPSTSSPYSWNAIAYVSGTGWGAVTSSGYPTNMPDNSNTLAWSAFADPVVTNKAWVIAPGTVSSNNLSVYRVSLTVSGTTVTWGTTAIVDDTLNVYAGVSGYNFAAVTQPMGNKVDWMTTEEVANNTYALVGDYTQIITSQSASNFFI